MGKGDPKGGRPRKEIDMALLTKLCQIQCTALECAAMLGVSDVTLDARLVEATGSGFLDFFKSHSGEGKVSLRRAQFKAALGSPAIEATETTPAVPMLRPNITMQIWLGKQWLDQKDQAEHMHTGPEGKTPVFKVIIPGLGRGNGRDHGGIQPAAKPPRGAPKPPMK